MAAVHEISSDHFREVIGHFATGVAVITTIQDGESFGTTASAVTSLSLEPPMLLVCLNQDSATGRAIAEAGIYAVNVLTEAQSEMARHFAVKGPDKFAHLEVERGAWGEPLLTGALARIECRVVEEVVGGTHVVFIAKVEHAEIGDGTPLAYFRGAFGRLEVSG